MSSLGTSVSLGDMIWALGQLRPSDDATRRMIAELLGIDWEETQVNLTLELAQPIPTETLREQPQVEEDELPQGLPHLDKDEPSQELPLSPSPSTPAVLPDLPDSDWIVSTLEYSPPDVEVERIKITPLPRQKVSEEFYASPSLEPLFMPVWTRGILGSALSTSSGDGPPDIEGIVEILARGEYVQQLPRLPQLTLRRGVQLLVDRSDSMVPFMRDQVWLQNEILQVVGKEKVEILHFLGCPSQGVATGYIKNRSPYHPPFPGTVVLLLSDLGIGRPRFSIGGASVQEWLNFASVIRRACCPLVAFVPYPSTRWPRRLTSMIALIQWDRETTASTVHKLIMKYT